MKTRKIRLGSEYSEYMRTRFREKIVKSKKLYTKSDRKQNKVRF